MPPLLDNKNPSSQSVFRPAALLRVARRFAERLELRNQIGSRLIYPPIDR
jgi:hypothetical protein